MPKTISAGEAKTELNEYREVLNLREQTRRQEALAALEELREQVQARNQDLDEAQAESLADRFTRDVIDDMVAEKKIKYQTA